MTHYEAALHIYNKIETQIKTPTKIDLVTLDQDQNLQHEKVVRSELRSVPDELRNRLEDEFFGWGPLSSLIEDPDITEIIINSRTEIWYERCAQIHKHDDKFYSEITFNNFIQRLLKYLNTQYTLDRPFVCESYKNLRIHISSPAVTEGEIKISIRKHKATLWSLDQLMTLGWAELGPIQILKQLIANKKNLLIIGSTGCGKTTILNSLIHSIEGERIVILEDTNELKISNGLSTKLLTREDAQGMLTTISLSELLRQSLRMRPDRIVVGEIRGPEAKDLLMSLSTGHQGSMGTLHAYTAQEALLRLEMLVQLGAPQWNLEAIRKLIFLSVHYIITLGFDKTRGRFLKSIHQVSGIENFGVTLDSIFEDCM